MEQNEPLVMVCVVFGGYSSVPTTAAAELGYNELEQTPTFLCFVKSLILQQADTNSNKQHR